MLAARSAIDDARVLDLYAGTGALALEALSRGAAEAILVESGREALDVIRANIQALGVEKAARVLSMPVERAIKQLQAKESAFDLVFADPPYAEVSGGAAVRALVSLVRADLVAPGGTLILEHASADPSPAMEGLAFIESRRHGDTTLSFYGPMTAKDAADT